MLIRPDVGVTLLICSTGLCIFVAYSAILIPSQQRFLQSRSISDGSPATVPSGNVMSTVSESTLSSDLETSTETIVKQTTEKTKTFNKSQLILIDKEGLTCLPCNLPNRALEFIVFEENITKMGHIHLSDPSIIYKALDDPSKDFYVIEVNGKKRAIRKFKTVETSHGYSVPENVDMFLWEWKRSRFIDCQNIDMNRTKENSRRHIPLSAIDEVAELRDLAISHRVTLLLDCGTKLGWYRECSLIPHTNDLDLAIMYDEHSGQLLHELDTSTKYHLFVTYGEPSKCFVFKLMQKAKLDISYMYRNSSLSWTCSSLEFLRMRYAVPKTTQNNICVGDLHGKLMFVPCDVLKHVEEGHKLSFSSKLMFQMGWKTSGHNIFGREDNNGTWTVREQSEDYQLG
ncbi:hypothetical protein QR680_016431 [Steinernema hermaphroditum]|uniref:W02B3.4-like N-terminal domain-containing protein n=1 Tax=Steinernema hermaphroditum TaxID=289476 RepID=A0AA39HD68_9BILA|nr:hypothetical protein QR680_016431 [Steinernema hermaphroditum]